MNVANARKLSRTAALPAALMACALAACTPAPPPSQPPPVQQPTAGPIGAGGSTGSTGSPGSGNTGGSGGVGTPLGPVYGSFTNGDFESGTLAGWSTTGNVSITSSAHGGSYAAQLGGPRTTRLSTLAQSFQLPSSASWLSFWYRRDCDDATDDGETFATLANADSSGVALTLLAPSCSEDGGWLQAVASISSYAGAAVTLRFSSGSNASASAAVLLVDDVQLSAAPGAPVCPSCESDVECGAGTVCLAGSCEPVAPSSGCTFDLQCGTWEVCTAGSCTVAPPDPSGCDSDLECGTGEACEGGACVDASYSPSPGDACSTDADCGAMSCAGGVCTVDGGDGGGSGDSGSAGGGSTGSSSSGDSGSAGSGSAGGSGGDDGSGDDGCGDSGSASSGGGDDGSGSGGDDGSGDDGSGDDGDGSGDRHPSKKLAAKRRHAKQNCRRPRSTASFSLTIDLTKK